MTKNDEIINKLKYLESLMGEYVKYLQDYTYHPWVKVKQFTDDLHQIIEEFDNDY